LGGKKFAATAFCVTLHMPDDHEEAILPDDIPLETCRQIVHI